MKRSNPPLNVTAIIRRGGKTLFGKRRYAPKKGMWDLIGGFAKPGERPRRALLREIKEETGCNAVGPRRFFSQTARHGRRKIAALHFVCGLRGEPRPSREISEFLWSEKIPPRLAFPSDRKALVLFYRRTLRSGKRRAAPGHTGRRS